MLDLIPPSQVIGWWFDMLDLIPPSQVIGWWFDMLDGLNGRLQYRKPVLLNQILENLKPPSQAWSIWSPTKPDSPE